MQHSGFNPKARWDRHIPQNSEEEDYNPQELNERIEVFAWFSKGKIQPRLFIWKNQKYKIRKITYYWQERQGQVVISYFSINTDADLYQISFNNTTYSWRIDRIIT